MSIAAALHAHLVAGLPAETDIHALQLPEKRGEHPAVTYRQTASRRPPTADGTATVWPVSFQLDLWAYSYDAVKTLQEQVSPLLDDYRGDMGDYRVDGALIESELDGFEPETGLYRVTMFIEMWQRRITP